MTTMARVRRATPQASAIAAYSDMWESLVVEAKEARRGQRGLFAKRAMYWSRIVLRAIEAEERDPEPVGIVRVDE